jgi:hypothetical protein
MLTDAIPQKPYNCLAAIISDAVINNDMDGNTFLTGYSDDLGARVKLHYRKANKSTLREGSYVATWKEPPGRFSFMSDGKVCARSFPDILEAEKFLRTGKNDLDWVENLPTAQSELIFKVLECNEDCLTDEEMLTAMEMAELYSPECREMKPERFNVPYIYRTALSQLMDDAYHGEIGRCDMEDECLVAIGARIRDIRQEKAFTPYP